MFHLTEETRSNLIELLRERLPVDNLSEDELNEVIDAMIDTVKKQFGM